MDTAKTDRFIADAWDGDIVPQLVEYIRIPNKSPMFDAKWKENGYMDAAVKLLANWAKAQPIAGMQVEVLELEGRTPLIYIEIEGEGDDCVLLYGHLDKQPEMTGWADDLGPGSPSSRATSSTAAAAPTTATRCSAPSPPSARSRNRASRTPAA